MFSVLCESAGELQNSQKMNPDQHHRELLTRKLSDAQAAISILQSAMEKDPDHYLPWENVSAIADIMLAITWEAAMMNTFVIDRKHR